MAAATARTVRGLIRNGVLVSGTGALCWAMPAPRQLRPSVGGARILGRRHVMRDIETLAESTDDDRDIRLVTARLADELNQPQKRGEIRPAVESEFRRFEHARVREFVPVVVERRLRADLRALARA